MFKLFMRLELLPVLVQHRSYNESSTGLAPGLNGRILDNKIKFKDNS